MMCLMIKKFYEFVEHRPLVITFFFLYLMVCYSAIVIVDATQRWFDDHHRTMETWYASDSHVVKPFLKNCQFGLVPQHRDLIEWNLLCFSGKVLGNEYIIPYIFNISVLPLTFLITRKITGKNVLGLLSMAVVMADPISWRFALSPAFGQEWAVFLLSSIYIGYRKPMFTPLFFIASVFSKAYALVFLPILIFQIGTLEMPRKNKIILLGVFFLITSVIGMYIFSSGKSNYITDDLSLNLDNFNQLSKSFSTVAYTFSHDLMINDDWQTPIIILATSPILIYLSIKKIPHAFTFLFYSLGGLSSIPLITAFTPESVMFPYRLLPIVVFSVIGLMIVVNKLFEKSKIKVHV